MPHAASHWTVEMLHALPEDGKRYEIIDGELFVNPAPRLAHQKAAFELAVLLRGYVHSRGLGEVILSPADFVFGDRTLVQPDVFVSELFQGREPREWSEVKLLLAIEVLSPSSLRADKKVKRRLFQRERVPEYWIVDLEARLVARWRPDDVRPEETVERLEWAPSGAPDALIIDLPTFFARVLGDLT